ncbi:TIGR03756 family integrating conjugative element protein [Proteus vulgaris]|uniref:TIGR03756 family integrating conjugative element protein n=1 Tax=Proteus vulgaris TaxID=585 RepID=UPI00156F6FF5|nr:TIGR03756 family integrating conjugative element protein [Proteus vulgaris]UBH62747.1 TIGR03756 family integrating conjugative element protein [Proteus vulgaris]UWT99483.1 TIGR03756 family integrating conjugative element protein [Proteus vulgaris]
MGQLKRFSAFALCLSLQPISANAINSAQIITSALSPHCLEYKIVGICYWLFCTPFGCSVKTSIKVSHYIPNAVVSSYDQTGSNPWVEMSSLGAGISGFAEGGGANKQKRARNKNNLYFKNVDVIGHPALASPIFGQFMGKIDYACSSPIRAFMPYFLSTLDGLMWRSGLPGSLYPEALIPNMREIGSIIKGNMWGNIYPRSGFVTQANDYKASAVVAQRAIDIVTRTGQLHVYQSLISHSYHGYWAPESVTENTGTRNHKWQRLSPSISSSCSTFPDDAQPIASDGGYAWALWQPYKCCKRRGQIFLYSFNFQ